MRQSVAMVGDAPMVKIGFRDDAGDVETLWAIDLGNDLYELANSSWFQYNVSWKDVVEASPEPDGMLFFTKVVQKSGHRTVRVTAPDIVDPDLLNALVGLGCTYEGANKSFIAIDVPAEVSLPQVVELLQTRQAAWEHADPSYGSLYGSDA